MSGSGRNRIVTNAATSVLQIAVAGATLFILYRFLLKILGPENLGIWSLVLATTSVTQAANLGFPGGSVRFVAKYRARGEDGPACGVVHTAAISIGAVLALALTLGYPVLRWILGLAVPSGARPVALELLPFSMASLWLASVASVFQGGLDGCDRYDIRNVLQMAAGLLQLVLCIALARQYGLIGLAYAAIVLNTLVLAASWFLLKSVLPGLSLRRGRWDKALFKELVGYGSRFQFISLVGLLNDPATKGLIGRFGGLAALGYYDMASRLVVQVRGLVVAANQVMVPRFASLWETSRGAVRSTYLESYKLLFFVATTVFAALVVFMPVVSLAWIGRYEPLFVLSGWLIAAGYFVNTLNAPAYFLGLGTGELKWNVISHAAIGVLNVGLGLLLGTLFKGIGAVVGWTVALAAGSCLVMLPYHFRSGIPLRETVPRESLPLFLVALTAASASVLLDKGGVGLLYPAVVSAGLFLVVLTASWRHPERPRLFGWITSLVSGNAL